MCVKISVRMVTSSFKYRVSVEYFTDSIENKKKTMTIFLKFHTFNNNNLITIDFSDGTYFVQNLN